MSPRLMLLALIVSPLARGTGWSEPGFHDSPRARRLLEIARDHLPEDWRYPETEEALEPDLHAELTGLLPVKVREQRTSYSCGAASLGILVSQHGLDLDDHALETVTRTTESGVDPWLLVEAAQELGFEASQKYDATVEDVLRALREGRAVLIDYQASYTPDDDPAEDWGHFSVIVAADDRDFLVVDPSSVNPEQIRRIPRDQLATVWWDTTIEDGRLFRNWMMVIKPGPMRNESSALPKQAEIPEDPSTPPSR